MENRDLFTHLCDSKGYYDVAAHLAEMIALLGPPPIELIDREIDWSKVKWSPAVSNPQGGLSQTARELYGGPSSTLMVSLCARILFRPMSG